MKLSQLKKSITCMGSAIQSPLMVASSGTLCVNQTKKHLTRRSMLAQGKLWAVQSAFLEIFT
jgi:hypothetical protein